MKKLEKLKAENKKLKQKAKESQNPPLQVKLVTPHPNRKSPIRGRKGRNKHDKPSYNCMSFNYSNMPNSIAYTFVPCARLPILRGQTITNGCIT
jgi:hypothetical protein